jgi:hypothetical protein
LGLTVPIRYDGSLFGTVAHNPRSQPRRTVLQRRAARFPGSRGWVGRSRVEAINSRTHINLEVGCEGRLAYCVGSVADASSWCSRMSARRPRTMFVSGRWRWRACWIKLSRRALTCWEASVMSGELWQRHDRSPTPCSSAAYYTAYSGLERGGGVLGQGDGCARVR